MDAQLAVSAILIGLASAYLVQRGWRALRPTKSGCSGGCGCAKTTTGKQEKEPVFIPSEQLVLRQRTPR